MIHNKNWSTSPESRLVRSTRKQCVAIFLALICGGIYWSQLIYHKGYDYDEVLRAHSVWLTSVGLKPYQDFFECHPPYFRLLSPLFHLQLDAVTILEVLRLIAFIGNALFLAGLATLATITGNAGRLAAILGSILVAFHPAVIPFLSEFRIDGWGYALATWGFVLIMCSKHPRRYIWFGIITGVATILFCPKIAFLPPIYITFDLFIDQNSRQNMWKNGARYAFGLCIAGAIFYSWILSNGISFQRTFDCLVKYNSISNSNSSYGHGMLGQIIHVPALSLPILGAAIIWGLRCIRKKITPNPFLLALAVWLPLQAMLVSYPFKQYYAPWFLFASVFFPALFSALCLTAKRIFAWLFCKGVAESECKRAVGVEDIAGFLVYALCLLSILVSIVNSFRAGSHDQLRRDEDTFLLKCQLVLQPEDYIVAVPPRHPFNHRDTFYNCLNTSDPGGFESEEVLDRIPQLKYLVSDETYLEELVAHPPALVVLWKTSYPRRQKAVFENYVDQHGYVKSQIAGVPVAIRPDRLEMFQRVLDH